MGVFANYVAPGVFTETRLDPSVVGLNGNIRIPALIGTADEVLRLTNYEMVRGSSESNNLNTDQKKSDEILGPTDGLIRTFTVNEYPIVNGKGSGTITNLVSDVLVKVNGIQVIVAAVNGLSGQVTLAIAPQTTDIVTITYYYKKTDTKVTDESVSDQVGTGIATFYTDNAPIVDGTNAGKTTTKASYITVKVNGVEVKVLDPIDGTNGEFTLADAPLPGNVVTVTYWFNNHANTADDLPQSGIVNMIGVGLSEGPPYFAENIDYAIINNQIQWGTGTSLVVTTHTDGSTYFDEDQIVGVTTVDDRIYLEDVSSQFATVGTTVLTTRFFPIVDGTGRDIVTNDSTKVVVKVTVPGPVTTIVPVRKVVGETGKITLVSAPPAGAIVEVTYWRSRMKDDSYAMEVLLDGVAGTGSYKITSAIDGQLGIARVDNVADWITPPTVENGFTIDETVTLTITAGDDYVVTSSAPLGTNGYGKKGRTYIDAVTRLIFAVDNAVVANRTITVVKNATFITGITGVGDSDGVITSIPGVSINKVSDTSGTTVGDVTTLYAFDKSGQEPNDFYYITYDYIKTDYEPKLFTKFEDVQSEYGTLSSSNPLVLAARLAIWNGANAIICAQVKKAPGSSEATDQTYIDMLEKLKLPIDGFDPSIILPLTTSEYVINQVSTHVNSQSSKRARKERIGFFGFAVGTEPNDAATFAQGIKNQRMVALYPDGATMQLNDPVSQQNYTFIVDGSFIAAAFAGMNVSAQYDVATPMTRKTLAGFVNLVRAMDETTMDMMATKGVTIIAKTGTSTFFVRHCLTTNMDTILTRELNVVTVQDFVQQETRRALDQFIGKKFLESITADVQATLSALLQGMVSSQIIVNFSGVSAIRDAQQPDFIRASAFYTPIVGVNYIEVVFNIRTRF